MPRVLTPARLIATVAAALVLPFLALGAPAHADDAPPQPTRVTVTPFNELDNNAVLGLAANVSLVASGEDGGITGTVTFRDDQGDVLASGVVVSTDVGYAQVDVPKPTQPTTYFVDFHGTGGFADSTGSVLYTPTSLRTVDVAPEPTIVKITAGSPQLTLTLSAYARFTDGTPAPGVKVFFDGVCLINGPRGCQQRIQWCTATSDANGFASCKGAGLVAAVVSILSGSVFMDASSTNPNYYVVVTNGTPPVIART
jgi:hypothetical protein